MKNRCWWNWFIIYADYRTDRSKATGYYQRLCSDYPDARALEDLDGWLASLSSGRFDSSWKPSPDYDQDNDKQPRPTATGEFAWTLHPNYPNPFNPSTTISYELKEESLVKLEIYDIKGRLIAMLVDGVQPAGRHAITWEAVHVPSGVYFYRIRTEDFTATRKLILLR